MSYPIERVLREGGDEAEFNSLFDKLKELNLPRLQIMEEVCARLEFAELVKYGSDFTHYKDVGGRMNIEYQTDRLVTYLALTSLDVIAREQFSSREFHDFPQWFLAKLSAAPPPDLISSLAEIHSLHRDLPATELLKAILPAAAEAYYHEEGVSRLFKRLLLEVVEPWMKDWLCTVFFLANDAPFRDTVRPSSLPWANLGTEQRFPLLAKYLFYLRNQYTHTTRHLDTQELSQFRGPDRGSPSFSIRYTDIPDAITDRVKWFVALRSDLSESEVVRMLAVHVLREWLGYSDGPAFIDMYLSRLKFRLHAYALGRELTYNSGMIGRWATIESRILLISRFDLPHLLLATASAHSLVAIDTSRSRYRPFLIEELPHYLQLASTLNTNVQAAFNEAAALEDSWRADRFIRPVLLTLAVSPEAEHLLQLTDELHQLIDQTLSVPFY